MLARLVCLVLGHRIEGVYHGGGVEVICLRCTLHTR